MLDHFCLACYRFHIQAVDEMCLPVYKGGVLRGGFGSVFRRTVCCQPDQSTCRACTLHQVCVYPQLFEPSPPPGSEALRTHEAIPLPFVLEPPLNRRRNYAPGEELTFGLTLLGRATRYLPYFIVSFLRLGEVGLGKNRARYNLRQVDTVYPPTDRIKPIFRDGSLLAEGRECEVSYAEIVEAASTHEGSQLTLRFLTPTRLKHNGRYVDQPDFHVVFRALLRRVSSLSYFHCGERWETDYRGWIEKAKAVRTVAARAGWVDWERYSARQRQHMNLGGVIGEMTYAGELGPFMPLLALGQYVHVGKACAFGNGQYVMVGRED